VTIRRVTTRRVTTPPALLSQAVNQQVNGLPVSAG
jgi:hypothetical protein